MTDHFTNVNNMIGALRSDDAEERLNSVRGLHLIAATLGPDRVKGELIPFLTNYLDESDDVLREFAKVLATMIPEVGGVQHAQHIITPLETLCGLEDVTVRDEAISSLCQVGEQIIREGTAAQQADFVGLAESMARSTSPQTRYSAASLLTVSYPFSNTQVQSQIRQSFQKLCTDEEILVRRGAIIALGQKFAKVLGDSCNDMIPSFVAASRDSNDGIRLQCISTAVAILPYLNDSSVSQVTQAYKALATDATSWRVRYMAADKLAEAGKNFSATEGTRVLFEIFKRLVEDTEPEIRASAVFHMHEVLPLVNDAAMKKSILTLGASLGGDADDHVRMSVATSILRCAPYVTKDLWNMSIVTTCSRLLNDSEADVKLAIISSFGAVAGSPEGKEIAPKLVPVVCDLGHDRTKWRVREAVVQQLPALIANLSREVDDVLALVMEGLTDRVATIREAACQSCYQLLKLQGMAWGKSTLFPKVLTLSVRQSPSDGLHVEETEPAPHNYLRRVTFMHLLQTLLPLFEANTLVTSPFLEPLKQLTADVTANVRINVARLLVMAKRDGKAGSGATKEVDDLLKKLASDADVDVKDEATRVLS